MLSQYEKNLRVLKSNYDNWKTTPPDYYDDDYAAEYAAEHPDEAEFLRSNFLTDQDIITDNYLYNKDIS